MKKTLSLVLALVLALGVFCAPALAAEYPLVSEPVTVSGLIEKESVGNERILWKELEKLTGIHVEWTAVESDSMPVFLAAGNWPDFFHFTLDSAAINDYGILGGKFVDYNAHLDEMPHFVQSLEDYSELAKAITETNGAIYQLPYIEESATTCQARVYYREDTLRDAGCEIPTTTEEFYEVLKKLKEYNNGAAPLIVSISSGAYFEPFMYASFGASRVPDFEDGGDGSVVFNRTSEQYKRFLTYMNQLYKEGLLDPEFASNSTDILTNYLAQDRMGAMYGYITDGYTLAGSNPHYSETTPVVVAVKPLSSEFVNEGFYWNNDPIGSLYGISRDCKDPESAFKFLDFCFRSREEWIVEDSDIALSCYHLPVALIPETEYSIIPAWMAERDRQIVSWRRAPLMLRYYTDEDIEVIETYTSDIQTYTNENYLKFITGDRDLSEFDQYVATLESMGMNEVIAVYQRHFE